VRITDFPPEGHPGLVEDCSLASIVAGKDLVEQDLPFVMEDIVEDAEDSEASWSSPEELNEDVKVETVDGVGFPEETQVFKIRPRSSRKGSGVPRSLRRRCGMHW
jgi:hypothetical protein